MRNIKNFRWGLLLMAFPVVLLACNSASKPDPGKVAENFIMAMMDLDFEKAKQYATKESASNLDAMAVLLKEESPQSGSITIKEEKIDGDKAKVVFIVLGENGEEAEDSLDLKMEDGEWKVKFDYDLFGNGSMDMHWEDMDDDVEYLMDDVDDAIEEVEEGVEEAAESVEQKME